MHRFFGAAKPRTRMNASEIPCIESLPRLQAMSATIVIFEAHENYRQCSHVGQHETLMEREKIMRTRRLAYDVPASAIGRDRINSDAGNKGGMICIEYASSVSMSHLQLATAARLASSASIGAVSIRLLPHPRPREWYPPK